MRAGSRQRSVWGLCALLVATACDDGPLDFACTTEFVYGLNLTVLDGFGAGAAQGALGVAVDGTFADTLEVRGDRQMLGAGERPGTYDITVSKPGHLTWSAENITVTANVCHVIPVQLEAVLIPGPGP